MERIFGVDGEMSGAEISEGHKLIQIGVALDTAPDGSFLPQPELFVSHIGWHEEELAWSEQAEQVHHIPLETVLEAPPAYEVDAALAQWLYEHGATPENRQAQIMCGFNVGVFDGPYIAQALPETKKFFARRYADLNPVCFMLASGGVNPNGGPLASSTWKKRMKRAGLELALSTGRLEGEHDAGTDALQALGAWRYVEDNLHTIDQDARAWRKLERDRRISARNALGL